MALGKKRIVAQKSNLKQRRGVEEGGLGIELELVQYKRGFGRKRVLISETRDSVFTSPVGTISSKKLCDKTLGTGGQSRELEDLPLDILQLSPVNGCSGIELLQADTFDLHCFQSLPGTKFFVVCEPGTPHMESLLRYIYELYTDYVLKNPFYEIEMPIRCELFDINLSQAVLSDRVALLGR